MRELFEDGKRYVYLDDAARVTGYGRETLRKLEDRLDRVKIAGAIFVTIESVKAYRDSDPRRKPAGEQSRRKPGGGRGRKRGPKGGE